MPYLFMIPVIGFIIMFVVNLILALLLVMTYTGLTKETPVAYINFKQENAAEYTYIATISDEDNDSIGEYRIEGDQWRLEANIIKMEYWASVLGIDTKYTLDRFQGRFSDINLENKIHHTAYQLENKDLVNDFGLFFEDTAYGSGTYTNIKLDTLYTVYLSPTGLLVREAPFIHEKETSLLKSAKEYLGFDDE